MRSSGLLPRTSSLGLPLLAWLACSGCGSSAHVAGEAGEAPRHIGTGEAFDTGVKCTDMKPPAEPDLMGWDPASRANLAMLRGQGVVAVRYKAEGCNVELEVLSNCIGEGRYGYAPYAATDTKIAHNNQELFTSLPIGAVRLGGKLAGGRALRTDYTLVGVDALPITGAYAASALRGVECERATHVISRLYLGGFSMVAGESRSLAAEANVFGAGGGASHDAAAEHVAREGVPAACQKAQEDGKESAQCAVPLRVGLLAIQGRAEGGCPAGSHWTGKDCEAAKVAGSVECPPGTTLSGDTCTGEVRADCPADQHHEAGRGCVANVSVAAVKAAPESRAPEGMVKIPAGMFWLGAGDGKSSEKPVRQVTVKALWMDVHEVSVASYAECAKVGGCPQLTASNARCNHARPDLREHPVNCIDWQEAEAYCRWAGKRLPSEEEWEYAARGSDGRRYPWGNEAPASGQVCWRGDGTDRRGTCAVGSFAGGKSPFGLFDMAGNVWELTASSWSPSLDAPVQDEVRVVRGGGWALSDAGSLRTTERGQNRRGERGVAVGFRCARAVE